MKHVFRAKDCLNGYRGVHMMMKHLPGACFYCGAIPADKKLRDAKPVKVHVSGSGIWEYSSIPFRRVK